MYVSELLAAMSFIKFNNGIHGRTYGDFLLGWYLSQDALLSCDKNILDNSRQGNPPGFFDAVNARCKQAAKHASREERRQYVFDVNGLRVGSLYSEWGAEQIAVFLAAGVKGYQPCRVCGTSQHEEPCVPIADLLSEIGR
jgi:nucleoside-diphosphate-sugar epimerase